MSNFGYCKLREDWYIKDFPEPFRSLDILEERAMLVKKLKMFPIEYVVRGYITGSGWTDYTRTGTVCGIQLPEGLVESQQLQEPIFTPSTKAQIGHDQNITFEQMVEILTKWHPDGEVMAMIHAEVLRKRTVDLYKMAERYAYNRGVIIADTKFEFGKEEVEPVIYLADEILTPDSSRFWDLETYQPGRSQPSYDKQYVRDYLVNEAKWNREPPAPRLPHEVINGTFDRYYEAYTRLFPPAS